MFYEIALFCAFGILAWFIYKAMNTQKERKTEFENILAQCADDVLKNPRKAENETYGVHTFEQTIEGKIVQIRFISDTLAVRKLPVLWLSISILKPIPMMGRYDVMCRPAATMSFSNFHLLPHALSHPLNRELHMQLRSSESALPDWVSKLIHEYAPLKHPHAKELIIDPAGIRFVFHLADADRARYGVLRQAAFSTEPIKAEPIAELVKSLIHFHQKTYDDAITASTLTKSDQNHAA